MYVSTFPPNLPQPSTKCRWIFTMHGSYGIFFLLQQQAMEPEHIAFRKFLVVWCVGAHFGILQGSHKVGPLPVPVINGVITPIPQLPIYRPFTGVSSLHSKLVGAHFAPLGTRWTNQNLFKSGEFTWTCWTHHWNPVHKLFLAVHPFCCGFFFLLFKDEKKCHSSGCEHCVFLFHQWCCPSR